MVDTSYYGNSSEWLTVSTDAPNLKKWNYSTLTAYNNGKIQLNEQINTSNAIAIADSNFWGGKVSYLTGNTSERKYLNKYIFDDTENPYYYLCFYSTDNTPNINLYNLRNFQLTIYYPISTSYAYNDVTPYLSLKNGEMKFLICVSAVEEYAQSAEPNIISCTIDDYFANYYNTHKYITAVFLLVFTKNSNNEWEYNKNININYGIWNTPTKDFEWQAENTVIHTGTAAQLITNERRTGNAIYLGDDSVIINYSIPIFSNGNYSLMANDGSYEGYYSRVNIGVVPEFETIGYNETIKENGFTIFSTVFSRGYYGIRRVIDLTSTDIWGENGENFYEEVKKQTAYFGMYFFTNFAYKDEPLYGEHTFLGIIDENGVTHGGYSQGLDNYLQSNYDTDIIEIDKKIPSDDSDESDSGDLTTNLNTYNLTSGQRYYAMVESNFNDVIKFINLGYRPTIEELSIDFKGKNPVDYIVNALIYPFDIPYSYELYNVTLGGINVLKSPYDENSEVVKAQYLTNSTQLFDFGTIAITPKYNDFRDYEPFTRCELQLPFCNTYVIDLKKFMGKNLTVKYSIDFPTGSCSAYIFLNDLVIDIVNGQIGYSIPLNGLAQGEYQNQIINSKFRLDQTLINTFSNFTNTATNIISGNVTGTISSIGNNLTDISRGNQIAYNLKHTAPNISSISTASPLCSFSQDYRARLVFYRSKNPNFDKTIYGSTVGYACLKFGKLSDFSGFLVISNIKLDNINCTDSEKNMLKNLLTSGVYN